MRARTDAQDTSCCWAESLGESPQVTTEEQREAFKNELVQTEDWLYEDGEAQTVAVFKYVVWHLTHQSACIATADPVQQRPLLFTCPRRHVPPLCTFV